MKNIYPCEMAGARAFYTGFDPRIIQYKRDKKALIAKVEQELKCLLLTKNCILCPASHLTSTFAFEFFSANPMLLSSGVLIPSLRSDIENFYELLNSEKSRSPKRNDIARFYNDNVQSVIRWELNDVSNQFRDWYLAELSTPTSVLRTNLKSIEDSQISDLIKNITKQDTFSRGVIDKLTSDFPRKTRKTLRDFRELIYHVTGANALNCESSIPQEEYLDYSHTDIKSKNLRLSPYTIFMKLFLESLYNSLFENIHSTAIIDFMTFEDIFTVRSIIDDSRFIKKYNHLIEVSMNLLGNDKTDSVLSNITDILKVRDDIQNNFSNELEKELKFIRRRNTKMNTGMFLYNTATLLSSLLSFVNVPIGVISLALTAKDTLPVMYSNVYGFKKSIKMNSIFNNRTEREGLLLKDLKKFDIKNGTELYDTVRLLNEIIRMRLKGSIEY